MIFSTFLDLVVFSLIFIVFEGKMTKTPSFRPLNNAHTRNTSILLFSISKNSNRNTFWSRNSRFHILLTLNRCEITKIALSHKNQDYPSKILAAFERSRSVEDPRVVDHVLRPSFQWDTSLESSWSQSFWTMKHV